MFFGGGRGEDGIAMYDDVGLAFEVVCLYMDVDGGG